MAATPAVGITWIWLALMGGVGTFPAGPPLPLDPVLSAIAPEECLWYASSAGVGTVDPNSSNETERLFAEPAVQRFFTEAESQIMTAVRRGAGDDPEQKVLAAKIPIVIKALLTRPVAAYVEEVQPGENESVKAEAAFLLNAGEQREELEAAQKTLLTIAAAKGLTTMSETAAGVEWQRVPTPPQAPPVRFGWKDAYFIVAVGEATPARIVERMGGAAPEWLTQLRAEHPIDREKAIGYLNVAGILQRIQPIVASQDPKAWPILEKLGLTSIRALHGVVGFDAVGCTSMAHVVTDGQRPGLLGLVPYQPLAASDLAVVPKDAMIALACRLNPTEVMEHAVKLASQFEPNAQAEFEQGLQQAQAQFGINIREDIVDSLGDGWVIYLPGGDLLSSWLNTAAAVGVKDAAKLRPAAAKLIAIAKGEMARSGEAAINESTVGEHTIYTLQIFGAPVPVSPSLCISDKWLIVGLSSQAVQAALDRKAEDSLAATEAVSAALSGGAGPAGLAYQDTPQLVRSLYPWVQMGLQAITVQLQQQGIQIDPSILPPAEAIVKHLRVSVATLAHEKDGFHVTSRGSLPGGGNVAGVAPVAVALFLPAVQSARQAARNAQELNSLKMLALATLNYESANGTLPTDVYSDDGKPLLSWRVRLLPYMEAQALYQRFNLDEPWDSEHNRPLLDQMPEVFSSPSGEGLANHTRFLALKGPGTLFPGNERLRLQNVTDGTSNTILFVHANPDAAVEWTKPADVEFDPEHPFAGVAAPEGQFLAVFNDGAARPLSLAIGAEMMKALATRAGDELIDQDALMAPPAPGLYNPDEPDGVAEPAAIAQ